MAEMEKCPNCGGTKSVDLGNGKHRCLYCGTSFTVAKPTPQPQPQPQFQSAPQPQQPNVVIVNQQNQNVSNASKSGKATVGRLLCIIGFAIAMPCSCAGCCHITPDSATIASGIFGTILIIIGCILSASGKSK